VFCGCQGYTSDTGLMPTTYNILMFDREAPPQSVFDVTACFGFATKFRILIYFKGMIWQLWKDIQVFICVSFF